MVQRLASTFGGGDSYIQIVLNPGLTDKVLKVTGSEAGVKRYIFSTGFT